MKRRAGGRASDPPEVSQLGVGPQLTQAGSARSPFLADAGAQLPAGEVAARDEDEARERQGQ